MSYEAIWESISALYTRGISRGTDKKSCTPPGHKALFSWHMNVLSGWFPVSQQHVTATVPAPQLVATREASPDLCEWEANALNREQEQLKR